MEKQTRRSCKLEHQLPRLPVHRVLHRLSHPGATVLTITDVRAILSTADTMHIWIKYFSSTAKPLLDLMRKDVDFVWQRCTVPGYGDP